MSTFDLFMESNFNGYKSSILPFSINCSSLFVYVCFILASLPMHVIRVVHACDDPVFDIVGSR